MALVGFVDDLPQAETFAGRSPHQIISWVLIRIGRRQSLALCNLKHRVDAKTSMWIKWDAFSILELHGKVGRVDATGVKL